MGKKITKEDTIEFSVDTFGLYVVSIKARCQSGKLLGLWGGENLRVELDNLKLREIPPKDKPQYVDIPPVWNGTALKGLAKTVIFLLPLNKGSHTLKFVPTRGALIEKYSIAPVENPQGITFDLNDRAEDGDRRPWYTLALIDLPLQSISAEITVDWHFFDGDDVKLIIDGDMEINSESKFWRHWLWHANPRQIFSGPRREKKTFTKQLPKGIHYLELWADKTPTLHTITLDLGDYTPKRTPTVDDPKWTGNFSDDTEIMILARLIFGEARNQSRETMIGIGWVVKNRVGAKRSYFGDSYHNIVVKNSKGIYQFSPFNPTNPNYQILIDPLTGSADALTEKAWFTAYEVASQIVNGNVDDPTDGATYFHSDDQSSEIFTTERVPGAIFTKQINNFLFYKDPNDA